MRLFRSKKQIALAVAPGGYSEEDPEKIIFDSGARLRVEANHWKTFCFILALIAGGAVYSRNPAPSVVKAYGVSSDVNGHAVVTQLTAYKPDDQAIRTALRETVERWFTIEPVMTDDIQTSRMARNINAAKAMMVGNARNQFSDWIKNDAPFQAITLNPKLVRERYHVWPPMLEPIPVFEARHDGLETGMVDERCPETITKRSAAFQLAARALTGENFRLYFEDYDVAHAFSDSEALAG